jgi:hypothetical protein
MVSDPQEAGSRGLRSRACRSWQYNETVTTHARSWACRCGIHLMLTFDTVPAQPGEPDTQFTCPGCGAVRSVPRATDARVRVESLKVRRA